MRPLRVYPDTSVIGGCLDSEFAAESTALLAMAQAGRAILLISDLLLTELALAPGPVQAILRQLPEEGAEDVRQSDESRRLRDAYLSAKVVGPQSGDDAHHVALATIARADVIASWNFKHIVHLDKIRGFNVVNLQEGYPSVDIRSPREIV